MKNSSRSKRAFVFLLVMTGIGSIAFGVFVWHRSSQAPAILEKIIISFPKHPGSTLFYIAQKNGYFRDQGIDMTALSVATGKEALDNMLQKKADFSIVADLPMVFSVAQGNSPTILATIFRDHGGISIVTRKNNGITSPEGLRGKKIGVTFNTSSQFFLDAFLMERQIPPDSVTLVNVKFDQIADAMKNGEIDAACTWDPSLGTLLDQMKEQAQTLDTGSQYSFRFQIVAPGMPLAENQERTRRVIEALYQAERYVTEHAADARVLVQNQTGMSDAMLKRTFDTGDIGLSLDQGLLLALDDQTRWAIRRHFIKSESVPNYLEYISTSALESVKRDAVTLAH